MIFRKFSFSTVTSLFSPVEVHLKHPEAVYYRGKVLHNFGARQTCMKVPALSSGLVGKYT